MGAKGKSATLVGDPVDVRARLLAMSSADRARAIVDAYLETAEPNSNGIRYVHVVWDGVNAALRSFGIPDPRAATDALVATGRYQVFPCKGGAKIRHTPAGGKSPRTAAAGAKAEPTLADTLGQARIDALRARFDALRVK